MVCCVAKSERESLDTAAVEGTRDFTSGLRHVLITNNENAKFEADIRALEHIWESAVDFPGLSIALFYARGNSLYEEDDTLRFA